MACCWTRKRVDPILPPADRKWHQSHDGWIGLEQLENTQDITPLQAIGVFFSGKPGFIKQGAEKVGTVLLSEILSLTLKRVCTVGSKLRRYMQSMSGVYDFPRYMRTQHTSAEGGSITALFVYVDLDYPGYSEIAGTWDWARLTGTGDPQAVGESQVGTLRSLKHWVDAQNADHDTTDPSSPDPAKYFVHVEDYFIQSAYHGGRYGIECDILTAGTALNFEFQMVRAPHRDVGSGDETMPVIFLSYPLDGAPNTNPAFLKKAADISLSQSGRLGYTGNTTIEHYFNTHKRPRDYGVPRVIVNGKDETIVVKNKLGALDHYYQVFKNAWRPVQDWSVPDTFDIGEDLPEGYGGYRNKVWETDFDTLAEQVVTDQIPDGVDVVKILGQAPLLGAVHAQRPEAENPDPHPDGPPIYVPPPVIPWIDGVHDFRIPEDVEYTFPSYTANLPTSNHEGHVFGAWIAGEFVSTGNYATAVLRTRGLIDDTYVAYRLSGRWFLGVYRSRLSNLDIVQLVAVLMNNRFWTAITGSFPLPTVALPIDIS